MTVRLARLAAAGAVDRFSGPSVAMFVTRVNTVARRLQSTGTLRRLSLHYFHVDFATKARSFDVSRLNQNVQ